MMKYAAAYLVVGLLLWVGVRLYLIVAKKDPPQETFKTHLAIAATLILLWPIVLPAFGISEWSGRTGKQKERERKEAEIFQVQRSELLRPWTTAEVEAAELVQDPLGAVPAVSFGHLHQAWLRFRSMAEGAAIWSFAAERPGYGAGIEKRVGYVAVRGDAIGPWFVTEITRT